MADNIEDEMESPVRRCEHVAVPNPTAQNTASSNKYNVKVPKTLYHGKNPNWKMCPFHVVGTCMHGSNCWYSHDRQSIGTDTDSTIIPQPLSSLCPRHQTLDQEMTVSSSTLHGSSTTNDHSSSPSQALVESSSILSNVKISSSSQTGAIGYRHSPSSNAMRNRIISPLVAKYSTSSTGIANNSLQTAAGSSESSSSPNCGNSSSADNCSSSSSNNYSSISSQVHEENSTSSLKNIANQSSATTRTNSAPDVVIDSTLKNWAEAAEFVPQSWRNMATESGFCPNFMYSGKCSFSTDVCPYIHGERCVMCQLWCLGVGEQRRVHLEACEREVEAEMEAAFAVQRSQAKKCGICHDVVWDKEPPYERRFGILERCHHVFCLSCIRTWRRIRRNTDPLVHQPPMPVRQCPECRVHSDFFVPSSVWVEDEGEKDALIQAYKAAAGTKLCKYYRVEGNCPLGKTCFYMHTTVDGGPPQWNE